MRVRITAVERRFLRGSDVAPISSVHGIAATVNLDSSCISGFCGTMLRTIAMMSRTHTSGSGTVPATLISFDGRRQDLPHSGLGIALCCGSRL
jgi:hypothetical protein